MYWVFGSLVMLMATVLQVMARVMSLVRVTRTMKPSYEQNTTKNCEIHGTVDLRFKRPVHEGFKEDKQEKDKEKEKDTDTEEGGAAVPKPHHGIAEAIRM